MKFLDNLLEKDLKLVEKRKIIFAIPLCVLLVAVILMIVFNFTLGSPLNLGTDFTGGYSLDIQLGNALTDSSYPTYSDQIREVFSSVTAENGKTYKVDISGELQRQGSGDESSIHVKYAAVNGVDEDEMSRQVNPALIAALNDKLLHKVPEVSIEGNKVIVKFDEVINSENEGNPFDSLRNAFLANVKDFNDLGADIDAEELTDDKFALSENNKEFVVTCGTNVKSSAELKAAMVKAMVMPDVYSGLVKDSNMVGATVSTELLFNAILAVVLALIFMLCYIGLRFQLSSGLACIIALFHDVLIMFCFMAICHIEINSTFIAALITILGYSINNSIIVFDRVRENSRSLFAKTMTPEQLANKSIKETLLRSINTTITTLIMILMVAIIGVTDIRIFAFPIIVGLLSGTFSSIFIAPSLWALFQRVGKGKKDKSFGSTPKDKNKENNIKAQDLKEANA